MTIVLNTKGGSYYGWTGICVTKSMERLVGTFSFSVSNKYPLRPSQWKMRMGDECDVQMDGKTIVSGYIDDIRVNYTQEAHSLEVCGRDALGDLVDCCYDEDEKQWTDRTVKQIITDLCDPFDISIVVDSSAQQQTQKKVPKFNVEAGQTVYEMLSKLCRQYAVLPLSYGDDKLTLTKVTQSRKAADRLVVGKNVLQGSLAQSERDRYSKYRVIGQTMCGDDMDVEDAAHVSGECEDDMIKRCRPLVMLSERSTNVEQCEEKAKWEARIRAARASTLTYKVQGWAQSDGSLWDINTLVEVQDDVMGVTDTLVIADLIFRLDSGGAMAEMTLLRKDAYDLLEERISSKETQIWSGKGTDWSLKGMKGVKEQESVSVESRQNRRGRV